jgi:hypothetical protein
MMLQGGDGPSIFSGETNPVLRQQQGETFNIFGKKISKKDLKDVMKKLSGGASESEEDGDMFSGMAGPPKLKSPGAPKYNPNSLYGSLFSMYGGQRVKGGLLGE